VNHDWLLVLRKKKTGGGCLAPLLFLPAFSENVMCIEKGAEFFVTVNYMNQHPV
jgi:hypothetical protein